LYKQPENPDRVREALKFYSWAFKKGGQMADELDYVAMPASVVTTIEKAWAAGIKDKKGTPIWN